LRVVRQDHLARRAVDEYRSIIRRACTARRLEEIEDTISVMNAYYSHLQIRQMAIDTGTDEGLNFYFGVYDVDDFYLLATNIPGYPNQDCRDTVAARGRSRTYSWAENAPVLEMDESKAITRDAARFANRNRE
jgi:hypothetical protein